MVHRTRHNYALTSCCATNVIVSILSAQQVTWSFRRTLLEKTFYLLCSWIRFTLEDDSMPSLRGHMLNAVGTLRKEALKSWSMYFYKNGHCCKFVLH